MRIRIIVKKVLDAFFIYIAMYMSGVLINNAMVGGALYLLGLIWLIYLRLFSRRASIPRFMAKQGVFYPDINGAFKYRDFICVPCRSKE